MNTKHGEKFEEFSGMHEIVGDNEIFAVDYNKNGRWIFGILNTETRTMIEVFDGDTCIHTLVQRVLNDWEVLPTQLWLSPCATILAIIMAENMEV